MGAFKKPANERWLDVGCGLAKVPGSVGVDSFQLAGVDVVHDFNVYPWPFEDSSFDHIVCSHVLSHLHNFVKAIEELHRIAKPGGIVEILAPHFASDNANTDPTIRIRISLRTMNYFCEQYDMQCQYYSHVRFYMIKRWLSFRGNYTDFGREVKPNFARWIGLEHLVNAFPRIFERFFVYWLPPSEVYCKLRVIK